MKISSVYRSILVKIIYVVVNFETEEADNWDGKIIYFLLKLTYR